MVNYLKSQGAKL